jgi:hypothetical protein
MAGKNMYKILMGLMIIALLVVGCAYFQSYNGTPEGTWECTAEWSYQQDGVTVPCLVVQQCTCTDNVMSVVGEVSIGTAHWSEKKEGTCYASDDELYGTWTSVQTVPKNAAARQFEQERFGGKSLAIATKAIEHEYRTQVTSRTDTQLKAVNAEGRVISCNRL